MKLKKLKSRAALWTDPETGEAIPVREAPADIKVVPQMEDIEGATPFDPQNCVYARCVKRMYNSTMAWCGRNFAYVLTLDEKGNKVLEHYEIRKTTRAYLDGFDQSPKNTKPAGFTFNKPCKSAELDRGRELAQRRRDDRKENGTGGKPPSLKGPGPGSYAKAGAHKAPATSAPVHAQFRNGSGLVHFTLGTITFLRPKRKAA